MTLTYEIKLKGSDEIKRYEINYPIHHYQNTDKTRKSLISVVKSDLSKRLETWKITEKSLTEIKGYFFKGKDVEVFLEEEFNHKIKPYYFSCQFYDRDKATFSGKFETAETEKEIILGLVKREAVRKYQAYFNFNQDLSYYSVVDEGGEVMFEWRREKKKIINNKTI